MPEGKVKTFIPNRNFGFITPDDKGEDVFFHISNVQGLAESDLRRGLPVSYESEIGPKGPRATIVQPAGAIDLDRKSVV